MPNLDLPVFAITQKRRSDFSNHNLARLVDDRARWIVTQREEGDQVFEIFRSGERALAFVKSYLWPAEDHYLLELNADDLLKALEGLQCVRRVGIDTNSNDAAEIDLQVLVTTLQARLRL